MTGERRFLRPRFTLELASGGPTFVDLEHLYEHPMAAAVRDGRFRAVHVSCERTGRSAVLNGALRNCKAANRLPAAVTGESHDTAEIRFPAGVCPRLGMGEVRTIE